MPDETNFDIVRRLSNLELQLRRHSHQGIENEKLNDGVERVVTSFETGEQATIKLYVPYGIRVTKVRGRVIKAIAATDDGTITVKNSAGSTMATLTASASTAIDTDLTAATPSANNLVSRTDYYQIVSAKTTAGGKVLLSIEFERT